MQPALRVVIGCDELSVLPPQVPVEDLSHRLGTLLSGIAPMLGPDLAVHYVYKSPRLRSILGNPEAVIQHLQDRYDEYVDVLGLPPRASLLAASESSHVSNMTVQKFRKKLEQFVDRCAATTHPWSLPAAF